MLQPWSQLVVGGEVLGAVHQASRHFANIHLGQISPERLHGEVLRGFLRPELAELVRIKMTNWTQFPDVSRYIVSWTNEVGPVLKYFYINDIRV